MRARRKSPVSILTNAGRWLTLKGRAYTDVKDLGEQKTTEAKSWKILFFDGGCVSGVALCWSARIFDFSWKQVKLFLGLRLLLLLHGFAGDFVSAPGLNYFHGIIFKRESDC